MSKDYPDWICQDCGLLYGYSKCGIAAWHVDTCGVCGKRAACTEPRDYGHLKEEWKDHESLEKGIELPTEEEMFARLQLEMPDPLDGIKPKRSSWNSMIQNMNDDLSKRNGFVVDHASVFRMVPEVGELVDAVLKIEGMKKIKKSDSNVELELLEEIRDGIGDVLVLLAQVASHYDIDMQEAFSDVYVELVQRREYHD